MKKNDFLRSEYFKLLKHIKGTLIIDCDFFQVRNFSQCLLTPGVKKLTTSLGMLNISSPVDW